jgi:hypothetical protein
VKWLVWSLFLVQATWPVLDQITLLPAASHEALSLLPLGLCMGVYHIVCVWGHIVCGLCPLAPAKELIRC